MYTRQDYSKYFLDIYGQVDFMPVSAKGSRMYDADGTEVIDFAAGIAVNSLGHCHPELIAALTAQAQKLWHVSNIMVNQPALKLGKLLTENSCCDKAFICNTGTEAIEAALKLARRYNLKTFGKDKHKIVSFKNSFHGRTLFAVSAGGQSKYSEDYAPLPAGISHAEYNNLESIEAMINESTAAVIVEPIQAEGGIIPANPEFLQKLRELCDKHQAILIFDEVQTGVGRTGKLFAYEHYAIEPDIICLAKALGAGFPIGAILVKEKYSSGFEIGSHGTTLGGNPLACAVATKAFSIINTPEVLNGVQKKAQQFRQHLEEINNKLDIYKEIRGKGLLIGMELNDNYAGRAKEIMQAGFKNKVATLMASPNVTRFTPSLIIPEEDIMLGCQRFLDGLLIWQ
jgi:acetylornithine/N-succinyldiaminopimelate aminotransferase